MKIFKVLSLWGSQILIVIFNLGVQLFLARLFTQQDVGTYFSIVALLNITATIGQFGLNKYLLIIFTKYKNLTTKSKRNIVILFLSLNLLGLIVFFFFTSFLYQNNFLFALLISPLFLNNTLMPVYTTLIQVRSKYVEISINKLIIPLIKVISITIAGFLFSSNLVILGLIIFLFSSIFAGYLLISIYKEVEIFFNKDVIPNEESKKLESKWSTLKILFPYALLNLTFMIYTQGNTFFVGALSSEESAALFANAYLILNAIYIFPTIIYQKVLAHNILSLIYQQKNAILSKIIINVRSLFIGLSSVIMIVLYLLSEPIILILFGESYRESILIFQFLLLALPFRLLSISVGTFMSSDFFIKKRMYSEIFITIINILMNIILISHIGLYGAVIVVLITEFLLVILLSYFIDNYFNIKFTQNYIFLFLLAPYLYIIFDQDYKWAISIIIISIVLIIRSTFKITRVLKGDLK
jgi:O-antigen/teichoic acid export membrane protein